MALLDNIRSLLPIIIAILAAILIIVVVLIVMKKIKAKKLAEKDVAKPEDFYKSAEAPKSK